MSYNILGINPFHNGSACVLSDGEIVYFLEEERLSRRKHDANPFRVILDILDKYDIDEVIIAGININDRFLNYSNECPFSSLVRKFYPNIPISKISHHHHLAHLSQAYSNSGFNESLGIVIDAGGSLHESKGKEVDSIYLCTPTNLEVLYQNFSLLKDDNDKVGLNVAASYACITHHLGFKLNEEGKTMGLSSYGNFNSIFPTFFKKNNLSNPEYLYESQTYIPQYNRFQINRTFNLIPLSNDSNNFSQTEKDLAWKIQKETQQLVGDYIEKYTKKTGLKHVCCSGGYFLNCVANYYFKKRFPDIEFYFEPISHDGGTAMGAAQIAWRRKNPNATLTPQKTLYYGPKYSKEELLEGIKKYT